MQEQTVVAPVTYDLQKHFEQFRENIIGNASHFPTIDGIQKVLYADWIASGRLYQPIEHVITTSVGPMMANTHSFSSETGKASTYAYNHARDIIKAHVNASEEDVLVTTGTGMTGALGRLLRIMGLRWSDTLKKNHPLPEHERPVVFISHMEHHSNQVPWMETIADVIIVPGNDNLLIDSSNLEKLLEAYKDRPLKIGAFTACSNVTGIISPYHELARIMHQFGGYCFVDFAASAPYVAIDMHPENPEERLDAIFFSPHKFLGGPGSCGVLVFNKELYTTECPDIPGGGNVKWTSPWGEYAYFEDIETREDSGTPGILQTMRAAMAIRLKEKMGVQNIANRENQLLKNCFDKLSAIPGLFVLGDTKVPRIGCVSFGLEGVHYNLIVRLLNDRYGIQVRGGWSCASTYGHHLFQIEKKKSSEIINAIENRNLTDKPGWVRLSLHPVTTDEELDFICDAIRDVADNIEEWKQDYNYNPKSNEFEHKTANDDKLIQRVQAWFD